MIHNTKWSPREEDQTGPTRLTLTNQIYQTQLAKKTEEQAGVELGQAQV